MKFFSKFFAGLGIGLAAAIVLSLIIYIWPIFQCAGDLVCGFVSCDTEMCFGSNHGLCRDCEDCSTETFSQPKYVNTFIFTTVLGTLVGGIWGVGLAIQDSSEKARRRRLEREKNALAQRQKNASMLKSKIESTLGAAQGLQKNANNYSLSPNCLGCDKQKKAWECINATINSNENLREVIADYNITGDNKEV